MNTKAQLMSDNDAHAPVETKPLAIVAEGLSKTYSEGTIFRKKFNALKEVSFQVREGEVFGLLGPNGAGKTTFIKILLGIIGKSAGSASLLGKPAGSRAGRRMVGYLPEHLRIPPHLNANSALEYYGNLSNLPSRTVRTKRTELLQLVGLADRANDRCKKYSKGMLQRLGLAQAMLHEPRLLILDEPTDGLDPGARAEMRQIIKRLKATGVTIFLNSHLLQEVELVCDRVAILNEGQLRYCGNVSDIGDFIKSRPSETDDALDGLLIVLEVTGDPDAVNAGFEGQTFAVTEHEANGNFTVKLTVADQAAIDELVDRLRDANISIRSLRRERITLEDAFLEIVK